jgi:hypothetical protein
MGIYDGDQAGYECYIFSDVVQMTNVHGLAFDKQIADIKNKLTYPLSMFPVILTPSLDCEFTKYDVP